MKVDVTKKIYKDEDAARARLRSFRRAALARWFGRPHCQSQNALPLRHVAQCNDCREQFSVTVGTVFERSKIGLHKWVLAARYLMAAIKKGMSAKQICREERDFSDRVSMSDQRLLPHLGDYLLE